MRSVDPHQPVVILGGFLITEEAYQPMAKTIRESGVADVVVVPVSRLDWLLTSWGFGWRRVLDRVAAAVEQQQTLSTSGQVTLVGHSSGGVMLRLYLSDVEFQGRRYGGSERCNRLVTLGSPHQAVRATPLRAMVDRRFPGCHHPDVDYVSVAGALDLSDSTASAFSRRSASGSYKSIVGDAEVAGDGLVPVSSALLKDARHFVLNATAHGGLFGAPWYGSPERVQSWWRFVQG
jgi:predicted ThiF/HesA family dinucleotide-utilizing enzyme